MEQWKCNICGYIYNPETGDPEGKIPEGTSFEDLPDNWMCPVCGAGKGNFTKA
ncbi:MAG TPA: rubredoxin [Chlorobaculum parvum]|uniref:Rubredoxin n=1 Tax=Chlorobaculum parvum TaxID=274539 RepID=A0A7C5HP99_9CHLB|nr:rubredoxin [Chlorobaculum parvum]